MQKKKKSLFSLFSLFSSPSHLHQEIMHRRQQLVERGDFLVSLQPPRLLLHLRNQRAVLLLREVLVILEGVSVAAVENRLEPLHALVQVLASLPEVVEEGLREHRC